LSNDLFNWQQKKPLDKILCRRKFYRYVVACMHNCEEPHFCREFWNFFDAKGVSPVEYYNEDGIGEKAMRRIVFDCDRCGKKDIQEVFGLYSVEGEAEENRLSPEQELETVSKVGHKDPLVATVAYHMMADLEGGKGWQHYCRKCFQKVADNVAQILNEKRPTPGKKTAKKKEPVETPTPIKEPEETSKAPAPKKEKAPAKKRKTGEGKTTKEEKRVLPFGDTA